MQLRYNLETENELEALSAKSQDNGNISAMLWRTGSDKLHGYGYQYDKLNQLKNAAYAMQTSSSWTNNDRYTVSNLKYDLNGNIQTLKRKGVTHSPAQSAWHYGDMDDLQYYYNGNRLAAVNDAVVEIDNEDYQFEDRGHIYNPVVNPAAHEYTYDSNGNMTADANKEITRIVYNHLNLPEKIMFESGNEINITYSAGGEKLRKQVIPSNSSDDITDYVNGFVYKNDQLDFFHTDEGRVTADNQGNLTYEYFLKDHLGNTRVSFKESDESIAVLEESHYYPFGMRLKSRDWASQGGTPNKFLYNGKELEGEDLGLNWYHYGARYYDPQLGRWHVVDLVDEYQSPYLYVGNNPVSRLDPDGMDDI
jgi:RHS repeat-associated protein